MVSGNSLLGGKRRTHQTTIFQSSIPTGEYTNQIRKCIEVQSNIGLIHVIEGFITPKWQHAQQRYYSSIKSLRTGKRWHKLIINYMWTIFWKPWEHRNGAMHDKMNSTSDEEERQLNQKIETLYSSLTEKIARSRSILVSDVTK